MSVLKKLFPLFLVSLIALVGCKRDHYNLEDLPPTVKGFFTVSKTGFDVDEGIQLTNASENADSYSWDFGDGTKSNEKDPVKTYTAPGIFTITLKAVGPGGTGTFSRDITITDPNAHTGSDKELYFIEYDAGAIRKISLEPGSSAEPVADISGKAGVGLAYDPENEKIYFSDFENTDDGKIWRMDVDGSNMEAIVSGITDPYSIAINLNGDKIYWADDDGNISRANLDGSSLERSFIHIDGGLMRGIAYDSKNDIIYFYEVDEENLYAAKSNGTGVAKIIEGAYGYSILVDEVNGKLYYEDRNEGAIMQANLDGSGIVKITDVPGTRVHGMAMDYDAGKFYWADRNNGVVRRCNLDGSGVEPFLSGLGSPRGIFIK